MKKPMAPSAHTPSSIPTKASRPVTVTTLQQRKQAKERITMVTCYDATFARLVEESAVDAILVGDSLGMVVKGEENTLAVSLDEMVYHTAAVARGLRANGRATTHLVGDMPFLTYQVNADEAIRNAGRLLQAGANAVKLEGGAQIAPTVRRIVDAGIPVMGHVGLVPQSVHAMGGFRVQGKDEASRQRILDDALALQEAGAYAVVLEGIPPDVAADITAALDIPTIGIGAGKACDGQVLVLYDLLGLNPSFKPKFVKHFASGADVVTSALNAYASEVEHAVFPAAEHTFKPLRTDDASQAAAELAPLSPTPLATLPADLPAEDHASYGSVVPN